MATLALTIINEHCILNQDAYQLYRHSQIGNVVNKHILVFCNTVELHISEV